MSTQPRTELATRLSTVPEPVAPRLVPISTITSSQRAAVIITMLGEAAAKPIVEKLDDAALAKVAVALQNISFVARDEIVAIVIDFLTHLRGSDGALRGGRDKAREVLAGVLDAEKLAMIMGDEKANKQAVSAAADVSADPWVRFARREPRQIATYLGKLSPNIIALILRKMELGVASEVLALMDDAKLTPAMGFMVQAQKVDPGIDQVLARMIEMEFLNNEDEGSEENDDHLSAIGELLSLIPAEKRDTLVKFLETSHEDKLQGIQKSLFTIDGLPDMLPKNGVPVVFRELDEPTSIKLLSSLQGPFPAVAEFLLGNISSRLADKLREELGEAKALSPEEGEQVQREFLSMLMTMKRSGQITLVTPAPAEA